MISLSGIDIGSDKTPSNVSAMKELKENLWRGNRIKSSELHNDITNPTTVIDIVEDPDDIKDEETGPEPDIKFEEDPEYRTPDTDVVSEPSSNMVDIIKARAREDYLINKASPQYTDPVKALSNYLEMTPARESVKIIGDFGKIGFMATNVSINDYGLAFIIKKDAIQFEPNISTSLKIEYRSVIYNVVYAGGFFTFPKIPFTFLSFIRAEQD